MTVSKGWSKPCLRLARSGTCPFGHTCQFVDSHSLEPDELRKRSICANFKASRPCPWGDKCKFLHETRMFHPRFLCQPLVWFIQSLTPRLGFAYNNLSPRTGYFVSPYEPFQCHALTSLSEESVLGSNAHIFTIKNTNPTSLPSLALFTPQNRRRNISKTFQLGGLLF